MVHHEEHFRASHSIKDIVIGMSDGLTVPFALAAGLSGAISSTHIVIAAGLAEIAAGSIAMGLGGYLAAKGDKEHFDNERLREQREVKTVPEIEEHEIIELMEEYGVTPEESHPLMNALKRDHEKWVDFMMKFELGLERPDPKRSYVSAGTIGISYIVGGLVPLLPYFFTNSAKEGLFISAGVTLIALLGFGYFKSSFTSDKPYKGAIETMLIGGCAATAAFFIAKLFA
jgi:vacuolar iron transporter family protein